MISFSDFNCNNAIADNTVGISIAGMIKKEGLRAYGLMEANSRGGNSWGAIAILKMRSGTLLSRVRALFGRQMLLRAS